MLLDLMLPDTDGFSVCREIRRTSNVPVIMVTARTDSHDVVAGLEAGADDYVDQAAGRQGAVGADPSPAAPGRAGRGPPSAPDRGRGPGDRPRRRRGTRDGEPVALTRTEFRLLVELAVAEGRICSREELLDGLGLRLLRRQPDRRRAHPPAADQGRARPGQPEARRDGARPGIPAGDLTVRRAVHGAGARG